jgi:hypothetical protein
MYRKYRFPDVFNLSETGIFVHCPSGNSKFKYPKSKNTVYGTGVSSGSRIWNSRCPWVCSGKNGRGRKVALIFLSVRIMLAGNRFRRSWDLVHNPAIRRDQDVETGFGRNL